MDPSGSDKPEPGKAKLGQISVNTDAFKLDLEINKGYQAFSAELLRLSLLVLTGLAVLWQRHFFEQESNSKAIQTGAKIALLFGFASAVLSAGAALLHRYTAAGSLTYHLTALRRRERNRPGLEPKLSDVALAEREEGKRDQLFRWSSILLRISASLLFLGLLLVGWFLTAVLFGGL